MTPDMQTLGFDRIIEMLKEQAISEAARQRLAHIEPILNESLCVARMHETTAARKVLEASGTPPLAMMGSLDEALTLSVQGGMLTPAQLSEVARFAMTVRRLERYLASCAAQSAAISSYRTELPDLTDLQHAIESSVQADTVLDEASTTLRDLRRTLERTENNIREKLNAVLMHNKEKLADTYITQRAGCYVVPVQRRYQSTFPGHTVDVSAKGTTVFMEPNAVQALRQDANNLKIDIDAEERRILWMLSAVTADHEPAIRAAMAIMTDLDVLFARARLSTVMHAVPVDITANRRIKLINARHPLLDPVTCVPLNYEAFAPDLGTAITGPNTGGKTVCLKTIGLLTLMAQCGLHIPCDPGTEIDMMDGVYCDIGDSQSIDQNLSTFSGHMTNVLRILSECTPDSLILLDELGSGTDPAEGSGLAVAILEELLRRKCMFLVTTHDPQVKEWAAETDRIISARMAFDRNTLRPLYRLELGVSGESCAIEIAKRLGMDAKLLSRARQVSDHGLTPPEEPLDARRPGIASRLRRTPAEKKGDFNHFIMGDSVSLLPDGETAIVFQPADDMGNVIIQLRGEKRTVRHNRLRLLVPATELYPPDYDFSIIFDTVANRKAAHAMSRKFDADAVIVHREGSDPQDA